MDDIVGISAFAASIGVSLETEPQLESVVEKCYRFALETVGKARIQRARGAAPTSPVSSSSNNRASSMPPLLNPTSPLRNSNNNDDDMSSSDPSVLLSASSTRRPHPPRADRRDISPTRQPSPHRDQHSHHHHHRSSSTTTPPRRNSTSPIRSLEPPLAQYSEEVKGYARFIGIDAENPKEAYLMPIAQDGFRAELPPGWQRLETADDHTPYYVGPQGNSTFEFPLDEVFRARVADARRLRRRELELEREAEVAAAANAGARVSSAYTASSHHRTETVMVPVVTHKGIDDRVEEMATYLGIDLGTERHMLGFARDALLAEIITKDGVRWSRYHDDEGNQYYGKNDASQTTTWELPTKSEWIEKIDLARKRVSPAPTVAFAPKSHLPQNSSGVNNISSISSVVAAGSSGSGSGGDATNNNNDAYSRELLEYADFIGVPRGAFGVDIELTRLAREGFDAPLPAGWASYHSHNGEVYYANEDKGLSSYDHPADRVYRARVEDVKRRRKMGR